MDWAGFHPKKGRHASAPNFPELCTGHRLRHHPSEQRLFARVSGNLGTTEGLHARRLADMRRADSRCGEDRGLLAAETPNLSDRCRAVFAERDVPSRGEDRDYRQRRYDRDYGHVATIVNMGQGPMTETSGRGRTMAQGLTRISTTKYR